MSEFSITSILQRSLPTVNIFDIGAAEYYRADRFAYLVDSGLAKVFGFDANLAECEKLNRQHNSENYQCLPYCLGQGNATQFYQTRHPGCSSTYQPNSQVLNQFVTLTGAFVVQKTLSLQTFRLDDLENIPQPDFIKLDVQGGELDVLKGATELLSNTLVIESEVEFIPMYIEQPLFGDMQVFLRSHGFWLQKFINFQGRTFMPFYLPNKPKMAMSQLIWCDAVFVKEFTEFRTHFSEEKILKTIIIMHEIYKSYDFVYWLLRIYDEYYRTSFADRYFEALSQHAPLDRLYLNLDELPTEGGLQFETPRYSE